MKLECPHCKHLPKKTEFLSTEENMGHFISRRVLSSDEMNGKQKEYNTVELWGMLYV
jgi:hypothetical protein